MKVLIGRLTKLILMFLCFSSSLSAQDNLVEALNRSLIPLKGFNEFSDFSDFNQLKPSIDSKRIFLMGEATHGAHEFFTVKHRLVQFLVQEMGYRVFIIEADMTGADDMNEYICNAKGTAKKALEKMSIGVWMNDEFVSILEWMKSYNQGKKGDDQIRFFGCDMQFAINNGQMLLDGKINLPKPLGNAAKKGLEVITKYSYGKIDNNQDTNLTALESELKNNLEIANNEAIPPKYKFFLNGILQTISYARTKYQYDKDVLRDKMMAENVARIYENQNRAKTIVWAHNFHISKDFTMNKNLPMGYYISNRFPSETYAMGLLFNQGSFRAFNTQTDKYGECTVPAVTSKNSVESVFGACSAKNFILDFELVKSNAIINNFLNQERYSRGIGGAYDPKQQAGGQGGAHQKLIRLFDGVIFINTTTATNPLK